MRTVGLALLIVIFLSIIPNGSSSVLYEGTVLCALFSLGAIACCGLIESRSLSEVSPLLFPLAILSILSLIQGVVTLFGIVEDVSVPAYLPYSFDLMASMWVSLKILGLLGFAVLWVQCLKSNFRFLVIGLTLVGDVLAVVGVTRYALQNVPCRLCSGLASRLEIHDGFGTFSNQNHFAFLMLMVLGLNIGLLSSRKKFHRACFFFGGLLVLIAIILTASRAGILGSFILITTFVLCYRPRSRSSSRTAPLSHPVAASFGKRLILSFSVLVILTFALLFVGQDRVLQRFNDLPEQLSAEVSHSGFRRIDVWKSSTRVIQQHWFFGIGFGGFRYAASKYLDISGDVQPEQAHNDFLELAASGGLVAVILFGWFLYRYFVIARVRIRTDRHTFTAACRLGVMCGLVGVAFHSMFDSGLQYTGNLLYFSAVVAISIHNSSASPTIKEAEFRPTWYRYAFVAIPIVWIMLAGVSAYFAYSRSAVFPLECTAATTSFEGGRRGFFFDSTQSEKIANFCYREGDLRSANSALENAIKFRPYDYALWLELAYFSDVRTADLSYRRAIELAPLYASPHFRYGRFLVLHSNFDGGLNELLYSLRRDPDYAETVLPIIWEATGKDSDKMVEMFDDLAGPELSKLADFLFSKGQYSSVASFACRSEIDVRDRDVLVRRLFEKRQFLPAWRIYAKNCGPVDSDDLGFLDGGFEAGQVRKGSMFGWTAGSSIDLDSFSLSNENPHAGEHSLRLTFDGEVKPPILSQIVPVESPGKFRITFAYRTSDITTGGPLVVQTILKGPEEDVKVNEKQLDSTPGWNEVTMEFEVTNGVQAAEFRLSRIACSERLCPVYGEIWIDDVQLLKLDGDQEK